MSSRVTISALAAMVLLPCTPLWLIARPLTAAALPPVARLEDDAFGVLDSAPRPSPEADVPPAAALPPVPATPLDPVAPTEPAPVPTVEADCAKAAPAVPKSNKAAAALIVKRLLILCSRFQWLSPRERLPSA